jgi:ATP-dependent DNA helicase Rep
MNYEWHKVCQACLLKSTRGTSFNFMLASRKQFGENMESTPSRFIEEMPEEDIEMEGFGQATKEQVEKKGAETISNLRNMFD